MYWCKQIRKKIMGVYNMLKIKLTCIKRNRIKKISWFIIKLIKILYPFYARTDICIAQCKCRIHLLKCI